MHTTKQNNVLWLESRRAPPWQRPVELVLSPVRRSQAPPGVEFLQFHQAWRPTRSGQQHPLKDTLKSVFKISVDVIPVGQTGILLFPGSWLMLVRKCVSHPCRHDYQMKIMLYLY